MKSICTTRGTCGSGYCSTCQNACLNCPYCQSVSPYQQQNDTSISGFSKIVICVFIFVVVLCTVKPFLETYQTPQEDTASYYQEADAETESNNYSSESYISNNTAADSYGTGRNNYIIYSNN